MRTPHAVLVLLLPITAPGCYATRDAMDDVSIHLRNRACASQAWHESGWKQVNPPNAGHFEDGFTAGYVDVASGKSGCLPALPPRKYWKPSSLDSAGRQASLAWYKGYVQGAQSAQEHGIRGWSRLDAVAPAMLEPWDEPDVARESVSQPGASPVRRLPAVVEGDSQHALRPTGAPRQTPATDHPGG